MTVNRAARIAMSAARSMAPPTISSIVQHDRQAVVQSPFSLPRIYRSRGWYAALPLRPMSNGLLGSASLNLLKLSSRRAGCGHPGTGAARPFAKPRRIAETRLTAQFAPQNGRNGPIASFSPAEKGELFLTEPLVYLARMEAWRSGGCDVNPVQH